MMSRVSQRFVVLGIGTIGYLGLAAAAQAVEPSKLWLALDKTDIYENSLKALVVLFVVAVLIESALSTLFNWRLFLQVFNGRGMKTLIAIIVAWVVVDMLKLDIVQQLLMAYYKVVPPSEWLTKLLTALIIAGGSNGVYNILVTLGYRDAKRAEAAVPTPPRGKAWLSVRAKVPDAATIDVKVQKVGPADPAQTSAIAGAIAKGGFWRSLFYVFFRDRSRFPQSGGYVVAPDHLYRIEIEAVDKEGKPIPHRFSKECVFAEGAIVDLYWEPGAVAQS